MIYIKKKSFYYIGLSIACILLLIAFLFQRAPKSESADVQSQIITLIINDIEYNIPIDNGTTTIYTPCKGDTLIVIVVGEKTNIDNWEVVEQEGIWSDGEF